METKPYLEIVPSEMPALAFHKLLMDAVTPRPIALASTISIENHINLAPFSFYNIVSTTPPILIISVTSKRTDLSNKDTWVNVNEVPEIVINSVSEEMVQQMNITSCSYPERVNEFEKGGLTPIPSDCIRPPRVAESAIQMECKVVETISLSQRPGAGHLVLCEIVKLHINKQYLNANNTIDNERLNLIGRLGKKWYSRTSGAAKFMVSSSPKELGIGIDALPVCIHQSEILSANDLGILGMLKQLPTKLELEEWQHSTQQQYAGLEGDALHQTAKKLINENKAETALLLLLSSTLSIAK